MKNGKRRIESSGIWKIASVQKVALIQDSNGFVKALS